MAYEFPSQEWTVAFKEAVNSNAAYREAGKEWTFGSVAMVVKADPGAGINNDVGMLLDVQGGQCRSTQYFENAESAQAADFVIVASYEQWKDVILGKVDPIRAMMEGKLGLTKGHLPTIIRFVDASRALVSSASHIETRFVA